jgi:hypothetical protein
MNRNYWRVAALALFFYLSIAPVTTAAPMRDRDTVAGPGERVVRVVKKIKIFIRGFVSQDDGMLPPVPKP